MTKQSNASQLYALDKSKHKASRVSRTPLLCSLLDVLSCSATPPRLQCFLFPSNLSLSFFLPLTPLSAWVSSTSPTIYDGFSTFICLSFDILLYLCSVCLFSNSFLHAVLVSSARNENLITNVLISQISVYNVDLHFCSFVTSVSVAYFICLFRRRMCKHNGKRV